MFKLNHPFQLANNEQITKINATYLATQTNKILYYPPINITNKMEKLQNNIFPNWHSPYCVGNIPPINITDEISNSRRGNSYAESITCIQHYKPVETYPILNQPVLSKKTKKDKNYNIHYLSYNTMKVQHGKSSVDLFDVRVSRMA